MENAVFWSRVKGLLKSHKMTQESLAKSAGLSFNNLKQQIFYDRIPTADEVVRIAKVLDTSVEYLVTGSGPQCQIPDDLMEVMRKYVLRDSLDNPVKDYLK